MKIFITLFSVFFLCQNGWSKNGPVYQSIKKVIEEVRPTPSMKNVDEFLEGLPRFKKSWSLEKQAKVLNNYIFKTYSITADNSYLSRHQADNILPDSVLNTKKGHCLGISTLYLLLAEKLELQAYLVRTPKHVFVRLCKKKSCRNIETLKEGAKIEDKYYVDSQLISKSALDKKLYLQNLDPSKVLVASIYNGLGFVAGTTNQNQLAHLFYLKATKSDPGFAEAHSNLAAIYSSSGELKAAESELELAHNINPFNSTVTLNLGILSRAKGAFTKAMNLFNKSISINPLNIAGYIHRSNLLIEKGNNKSAMLDLERVLVIKPNLCSIREKAIEVAKKISAKNLDYHSFKLKDTKTRRRCENLLM
ncbi:MAG: tetratricopeptide repeat protein [Bacteriovoracaceae bacterium]|jgi:tetratricopeptide (TPR) repeat protein|nr:tetratricopeptide repeat protein [Bacteriovoracaceae bacterium]